MRRVAGQAGIEAAEAEANPSATILALPSSSSTKDTDAGKSLMQLKQERDDEERKKRKADSGSAAEERGKKARKEGDKEDAGKGEKDFAGVTEAEMGAFSFLPRFLCFSRPFGLGWTLFSLSCGIGGGARRWMRSRRRAGVCARQEPSGRGGLESQRRRRSPRPSTTATTAPRQYLITPTMDDHIAFFPRSRISIAILAPLQTPRLEHLTLTLSFLSPSPLRPLVPLILLVASRSTRLTRRIFSLAPRLARNLHRISLAASNDGRTERYRRDREQRFDDPMAQLQGDELLPL